MQYGVGNQKFCYFQMLLNIIEKSGEQDQEMIENCW